MEGARFPILLAADTVYACHAAAIVHARMGWQYHEVSFTIGQQVSLTCVQA